MLIFIILELIHLEMVVSLHFKVDLLKSKSLEDFIENRGVAYKVWIIEVIYIIAGVIAFRINKFISIAIIAVSLVTFIRDIMNEKDIKTIKECNYATDTKIITVSSSNGLSKLVNNKYTLYYMLDEKKRGIDNYKALKIGKSYRVTLLKFAAGDYIIDYKETR